MSRLVRLSVLVLPFCLAFAPHANSGIDERNDEVVVHLAQAATPSPAAPALAAPADQGALIEQLVATGKPIYDLNCAGCHQANGQGDVGPKLAGNGKLADALAVHRQISQGGSEMPGFGSVLTPEEILAVGTYVRNSWGNAFGPLTEENIKAR